MSEQTPGKLVLIDGHSLLYRAFFALPQLTNAEGAMTNAAYGFTSMLLKIIDEERPDMMAVAFDLPGPTFRHERYPEYKATRERMPDELVPQIEMAREVLDAMHIPAYEMERYEADDVIGTLSARAEAAGHEVLVVTGDLDELQLVSDRVSVMVTRRGITDTEVYDVKAVEKRYGFGPEKLPDFRALRGDSSDNIPGVPGIGEKTASALIQRFGSLENAVENLEDVTPARAARALEAHVEVARRARELSLIVRDLPIEFERERLLVRPPDEARLTELFRRLGFRSLLRRIEMAEPAVVDEEHRLLTRVTEARALARELAKAGEVTLHMLAGEGPAQRAGTNSDLLTIDAGAGRIKTQGELDADAATEAADLQTSQRVNRLSEFVAARDSLASLQAARAEMNGTKILTRIDARIAAAQTRRDTAFAALADLP